MTKTYEVREGNRVLLSFRADFAQASSPIQIGTPSGGFDSTPFQVADSRHRPLEAAKMLNGWCRNQGGEAWERGTTGLTLRAYRSK